ncbi:MAG: Uma2 family endonuclease [Spirulinaceae cyanobacterium]
MTPRTEVQPLTTDRPPPFPDHTQLPDSDGTFVKNFQEHPQSILLTDSLGPILQALHPNGDYAIGQDCGIYWRETDPPERGAEAPDWFYVPGVPPDLDGQIRRSYVLWREHFAPYVALEFASGDGSEERDRTTLENNLPNDKRAKPGKFWVYEQIIRIPYYGIYVIAEEKLEVYRLVEGQYQRMSPNDRGHYPMGNLGIELGCWQGNYQNQQQTWLRWWDNQGNLLLTGAERAEQEKQRAEQEKQRAEQEKQRAEQEKQRAEQEYQARRDAIPRLLAMGLTPEQVAAALSLPLAEIQTN